QYWVNRWSVTKDLNDQPKSGHKRITTKKQDQRIIKLAKKNANITAMQICEDMKKYCVEVSESTIHRRLRES
ncbi:10115_t:CDS:1, partial [Racocetra persica]